MDIRTEERYEDDFNQGNLFIMKRSGERVPFDESKIVRAIEKANAEVTIPLEKMSEMIAEQLNCDAETITADTSFKDDLGADSLDLFELVMALEDEYNIEIPAEELTELNTVGDVIDYLRDKGIDA